MENELDEIFKFKEKCPTFNWANKSLAAKAQQFEWMEEANNTSSPLYKICKNREELARKAQAAATAEQQRKVEKNVLPKWFLEMLLMSIIISIELSWKNWQKRSLYDATVEWAAVTELSMVGFANVQNCKVS